MSMAYGCCCCCYCPEPKSLCSSSSVSVAEKRLRCRRRPLLVSLSKSNDDNDNSHASIKGSGTTARARRLLRIREEKHQREYDRLHNYPAWAKVLEDACKHDTELRPVLGDSVGNPELMRKRDAMVESVAEFSTLGRLRRTRPSEGMKVTLKRSSVERQGRWYQIVSEVLLIL